MTFGFSRVITQILVIIFALAVAPVASAKAKAPKLLVLNTESDPLGEPICEDGQLSAGVDLSSHQTIPNWNKITQVYVSFAFIKATEGTTFKSPRFDIDWPGAKEAHSFRSAYHFFMPADDPIDQAKFFLATVGRLENDDLPMMLDLENKQNIKPELIVSKARTWLQVVEANTGKKPIIYTSAKFWKSLGSPAGFEKYPLFIVDLTSSCPVTPTPWRKWTFWQHAIGSAPGVNGSVDLDVFNGAITNLLALTQGRDAE